MRKTQDERVASATNLIDVLMIFKDKIFEDLHSSTLTYFDKVVEPFNGKYGIIRCRPFPLIEGQEEYTIQPYYFSNMEFTENQILLVVYTDLNFINDLIADNNRPTVANDLIKHNYKFGVVVPLEASGSVTGNYVRYDTNAQGLSNTEKSNARTNIGAGTSNFSGSYNDLSNKPTIPTNTSQLTNDSGFVTADEAHTYPVGNTNYRIQFKVVNGQPQLEYEEII